MTRDLRVRVLAAVMSIGACGWAVAAGQALPAALDESQEAPGVGTQPAWQQLDAAGRAEVRARYEAWGALSEADRARIREAQARFASLPPDQQQALRTQFQAMDALHRGAWLLGPRLGRYYVSLQPLFGFVPPAQRAPALAMLRSLDEPQLQQLAVIAQRTPPQDRAALRNELLALTPAARAQWLRTHAGG